MKRVTKKRAMWGAAVLSAVFVYSVIAQSEEAQESVTEAVQQHTSVTLSTSTIPLAVSGMVEATDRALVSFRTSGEVASLYVQEGSVVRPGDLLAVQATPVSDATARLREEEALLSQAEQAAGVDAAARAAEQATAVSYSAQQIASLSEASSDNRVQEATRGVLVAAEANVTTQLDALQFVHDNKTLFTTEALVEFREIVANLYGSIPKQFQGGVLRSVRSEADLLDRIHELAAQKEIPALDIQNLAALLATENAALLRVYGAGESDILNQSRTEPNSEVYANYFAQRAAIIAAEGDLAASAAALSAAVDQATASLVEQDQSVAVSAIDETSAAQQAAYSRTIQAAAARVAKTATEVARAQQSLGEVRAPFAGVVTKRFVEKGEYAVAGMPLVQLEGVRGAEVKVTVPLAFVSALREGQSFVSDGVAVGVVDRFSPVSSGNLVSVVIVLEEGIAPLGGTIAGSLLLDASEEVYAVPRSYVHFTSMGTFVIDSDGTEYRVSIVYDAGAEIFVTIGEDAPSKPLRPAYSIALP